MSDLTFGPSFRSNDGSLTLVSCLSGGYKFALVLRCIGLVVIKRPIRDACLCMGDLQAPPALHFVFLITL